MQENERLTYPDNDVPPPEARQIWQTALRVLRGQVERNEYDYWLKNLVLVGVENGVALIAAPSSSARLRLENQYQKLVQQAVVGVLGQPVTVQFITEQPLAQSQMLNPEQTGRIPTHPTVGATMLNSTNGNTRNSYSNGHYSNGNNVEPANYNNGRGPRAEANLNDKPTPIRTGIISNGLNSSQPDYNHTREIQPDYDYDSQENGGSDEEQDGNYYEQPRENSPYVAQTRNSNLNPKYAFENFIVGASNRVTYSAARSVADNPGFHYNPLFIYGGVGLGKTHLLQAIGHEAIRQRPGLKALYVSSERFTNELVEAIRFGRNTNFRNRYRNTDILMIDDIQFIAGKESSQEEFFHTFNALHSENKQIVICSDRPPKAMLVLEDRLRSRFEGGFITDIQMPNYEMRLAILQAKAEFQAKPVPPEVLDYIAGKIESNIRELEGALTRVVGYALHSREELTLDVAKQALEEIMQNTRRRIVTPERVIETVSQVYNVDAKELKGRSRSADIVLPRQIAMYIIREHTECSLVEVGQAFGGRDHTTVMHGYDKIQKEIETNHNLRQQVNTITQILYSEGHS